MKKKNWLSWLSLFLLYGIGVALGVAGTIFIFLLESPHELPEGLLYHWVFGDSPAHNFAILFSATLVGVLFVRCFLLGRENQQKNASIKLLEEISRNKTELISSIIHYVRTPISALKFSIKKFLNGDFGPYNKEQKFILVNVYSRVQKLVVLTRDLLDVAKLETGRVGISFKKISLRELEAFIKNIIQEIKPYADERNIHLTFRSKLHYEYNIQVDLVKINQILDNLLENSIMYSPLRSTVFITLKNDNYDFFCEIKDRGIGIPKKEQPKIFTKFFRATNAKKAMSSGMGIGLYLCKEFVSTHQGKIWFNSQKGKGTLFTFTIPLVVEKTEEFFKRI